MRAPTVCSQPGCPQLIPSTGPHPGCPLQLDDRCPSDPAARRRRADRRRPAARARGYDRRWEHTRAAYLATHPLCECDHCLTRPPEQRPQATDVDHIDGLGPTGLRGHDPTNLRAMSHGHHSRKTNAQDGGGWPRP